VFPADHTNVTRCVDTIALVLLDRRRFQDGAQSARDALAMRRAAAHPEPRD